MNTPMEKSERTWLLLLIIMVVAVLAILWSTSQFWYQFPFGPRLPLNIPGDIEFFYTAKTVISSVNIVLLIFLMAMYISIYQKTRSEFTIGLIIFSAAFLMYALTSNPFVIMAFGFRLVGLGPFALLPDVFALGALAVLVYFSLKY
jgi:hypothetical protein